MDFYKQRYGLSLEKIPEGGSKTPDFICMSDGKTIFVAELKTLVRDIVSEDAGYVFEEDGFATKEREDNSVNRIRSRIEKAVGQLKLYTEPKIVILLNRDGLDHLDLKEAVDGWLSYGEGKSKVINRRSAYIAADLKEHISKIDLITWIDEAKRLTA